MISYHQAMSYNSIVYRNIDLGRTSRFKFWLCHLLGLPLGKSLKLSESQLLFLKIEIIIEIPHL